MDYQESLDVFRRGPEILDAALAGVSEDESRFVSAPGEWTVRQIARHVLDTEIVAGMRLRQMIAEERPMMATFDQDLWATHLGYSDCDPFDSAAKFRILRADMSAILDKLPANAFERVGLHPERGPRTLGEWISHFGAHADQHADQIRRARKSWSQR